MTDADPPLAKLAQDQSAVQEHHRRGTVAIQVVVVPPTPAFRTPLERILFRRMETVMKAALDPVPADNAYDASCAPAGRRHVTAAKRRRTPSAPRETAAVPPAPALRTPHQRLLVRRRVLILTAAADLDLFAAVDTEDHVVLIPLRLRFGTLTEGVGIRLRSQNRKHRQQHPDDPFHKCHRSCVSPMKMGCREVMDGHARPLPVKGSKYLRYQYITAIRIVNPRRKIYRPAQTAGLQQTSSRQRARRACRYGMSGTGRSRSSRRNSGDPMFFSSRA